ncbi:tripeptidyl peptidase A [Mycena floridula]|nr:tripeptidyl peptidase A [Mycena floridula]
MKLASAVAILAVFSGALASPSKNHPHKVKESLAAPPRGWVKYGVPRPDRMINLRIGLTQPNFHELEQHLKETSDLDHPRYGQHLTKEEVEELVAPHDEALDLVNEWLESHGLSESDCERTPAKDWIILTIPVSQAEKMLDTAKIPYLEARKRRHIELIQPTTMFARWNRMGSTVFWEEAKAAKTLPPATPSLSLETVDPSCNVSITISCLKQLYNAVDYKVKAAHKNSIAITSYLEEFVNEGKFLSDLNYIFTFYKEQVPAAVGSGFKLISVKGGLNDQNGSLAGVEANLDAQFAFGLSFPTPATAYTTAGRPPIVPDGPDETNTNEPYLDWLQYVLNHPDVPHVISTSYGEAEQTVPESYARRTCNGFAQLGARGVSVMSSSGDGGVGDGNADPATQTCFTNDGKNTHRFMPLFPAGCPFMTAVGDFFVLEGLSTRPLRQLSSSQAVVSLTDTRSHGTKRQPLTAYLKSLPTGLYQGLFNPAGRAIPDIAAQGRRFRVWVNGAPISVGGTSASSPTFAGIIALVNDARLAAGLTPLGFLNPLLYKPQIAATFNDITTGNNPGCGTPGFNATKGWDPVTGFGTPNLKKLLHALGL